MSIQCLSLALNKIKNIRRSKGVIMKLSKDEQVALNAFNRLSESQKKHILDVMDYVISLPPAQPEYPSSKLLPSSLHHRAPDTSG